jgi:putative peptidoglycan lipid II flippase
MGLLVPSLIKKNYLPKITKQMWNLDVKRILLNMVPGILGTGLLQITTIINTNFASSLGEGSNTYIFLADRLLELPLSLVAVSLGTALLPTLSYMWSSGDSKKMIETSNFYLRVNLFIALPASVGLYFLALPIVELLFQRGQFTLSDSLITASVVKMYAFTLVASSSVRVLVPAYYAVKNTWIPAVVSFICLVGHVVVAPILMRAYGIEGLVGSTMLSAGLNLGLLVSFFGRFIGEFHVGTFFKKISLFALPALGLYLVTLGYLPLRIFLGDTLLAKLFSLILVIGVGAVVYLGTAYLLKIEECFSAIQTVAGKVLKRLQSNKK